MEIAATLSQIRKAKTKVKITRSRRVQVCVDAVKTAQLKMVQFTLFCHSPKNGGQTLILSLGVVGCNDGNSSEFRKVTEEGYPINPKS